MRQVLVIATTAAFVGLALLHLYWAAGGRLSLAVVPQVDGAAAFTPTPTATVAVAVALLAAAAVVALAGGLISLPLPGWMGVTAALVLGAILTARAIGDFGLVGFFKTRGEGRFAQLDTFVYSPLCLALAALIFFIVATRKAGS